MSINQINQINQINLYTLKSIPYYNTYQQQYTNIIIINKNPVGPLSLLVKQITNNPLSKFESNTPLCRKPRCVLALRSPSNNNDLMCIDEMPWLFEFLINNGYTIDTSVTKVFQKTEVKMWGELICTIKYLHP